MKVKLRNNKDWNNEIFNSLERRIGKERIMPLIKQERRYRVNIAIISFWTLAIALLGYFQESFIIYAVAIVYYFSMLFIDGYLYIEKEKI